MQHTAFVCGGQTGTQLPRDLDRLLFARWTQAAQDVRQVVAVHVLHGEEDVTVSLSDVVDATNVGVGDLARGAHLAA
jgi:hypothetical protein